jgi:AraC-like DNA-binding protein
MTIYSKPIEESVSLLDKNLKEIPTVSVWAEFMGYSRSHFSTCFSECFGETPLECLCRVRYKRLLKIILQYPHETSRAVAQRVGLRDDQALYKFLNRHYDTNFTEVRDKLLNRGNQLGMD